MTKTLGVGLSVFSGVGFSSTGIAYYVTYRTILQEVQEEVILESFTSLPDVWAKIKSKLPNETEIMNQELKNIKKASENQEIRLKNWCFKSYRLTYRNLFRGEDKELLKDVLSACRLKIKDQLENRIEVSSSSEGRENESKFKSKLEILKVHIDNEKGILDEELKDIKENSDDENSWQKLESWCERIYERGYQGSQSNRWKLADLYCKNS